MPQHSSQPPLGALACLSNRCLRRSAVQPRSPRALLRACAHTRVCSTVTVAYAHAARGCYDCERAKLPVGVEVEEDVYGF